MKIKNSRLFKDDDSPAQFVPSPNIGGNLNHKYLVMHYTAGKSAQESVEWLANKQAKASAHVVIGRDGSVTQLVPFDKVAWHAGASSWEGLQGMNQYSLGIELDNAGRLTRKADRWQAWFGTCYESSEVIEAVHKHETTMCGWHNYTEKQIETALRVAGLLIAEYRLIDVIGHEDIAPHRKCDPGPAFPMGSFRSRLTGREEDEAPLYKATTTLNIRSGPGIEYPILSTGPLKAGTKLQLERTQGAWAWVEVQAAADISVPFEGWVNSKYLQRITS